MIINNWGWNTHWQKKYNKLDQNNGKPGRVIKPSRGVYRIIGEGNGDNEERDARLTGRARHQGVEPAVGDWVLWKENGGSVMITTILPRISKISRKIPGEVTREQVIAANVDVAFLVQGLGKGRSFTPRGLERYLAMAWESGCRPVVVLNKADLSENVERDILTAEAAAPGVEILNCSTQTGEGVEALRQCLPTGKTGIFVGPSGVGKSSLLNALAGQNLTETGAIRKSDSRGRHTTSHRELFLLDDGRLLLDTPGLRELQLWGEAESADTTFPEIEELVGQCRFNDCSHNSEPGCAVLAGLEEGLIEPKRFASWLDIRKELTWLESRRDEKSKREYDQKRLDISQKVRNIKNGKVTW